MTLINDFLSLIYPRQCESCGNNLFRHEQLLCNFCRVSLPRSNYHRGQDHELAGVLGGRIPFVHAMSYLLFEKSGRVQRLLHAIKYEAQTHLAEELGRCYAAELLSDKACQEITCIIPVPLHKNKLKKRGFNQSDYFARGLAAGLKVPLDTSIMSRTVDTSSQTRKRKFERWETVEGIFALKEQEPLRNQHVLLVDDVITTGATLEAAWFCLKEVEGIKISVASIAFAKKI